MSWSKFKHDFKNWNLRSKFLFCFLIVLIPLTVVTFSVSYKVAADIITSKTQEQATETIQQLSTTMDNYLQNISNSMEVIAFSPVVQQELNADSNDVNKVEDSFYSRSKQIRRLMLEEYSSISMHDMELYGLNGASYYLSVSSKSEENESEQKSLFKIAEEAKGNWAICNKEDKLQTIKLIKDLQTSRPIGYLRISLKRSYIDKMSNDISFGSNGRIIVLDSNSDAVCGKIDENLRQYFVKLAQNSGTMSYSEAGKTYTVIYYHSNKTEWETIGLIPNDYLSKDLKSFRSMMLIIAVILLGICVLITNLLAKQFISPIEDTAKALEKFSQGDFSVHLSEDRSDEIGRMNIVFNSTIQNVQKLMQKVTQAEILEREMEYKTLQSQMNPHFLYNTLDVINWMAWKKGEKEICRLITAVSNLMRISISNKQSIITLEQELSYVKDYLYIQHARYNERFEVIYNIDEDLLNQMIPKLIIQPIVENSIVHGIEDSQNKNMIYIYVLRNKDVIEIIVKDTGVGIAQDKIESLLREQYSEQESKNKYHTNLGLYAVNKRIKFLYGDEYGLFVTSKDGEWTQVVIKIAYMEDHQQLYKDFNRLLGERQ